LHNYIEKELKDSREAITNVSETTLRRFFVPPNKQMRYAACYKQIFNVRTIGGENTLTYAHEDDHYAKAQVKSIFTFVGLLYQALGGNFHSEEANLVVAFSVDDKAKVKVGIPAVSHYVFSKKYFKTDSGPKTSDHTFPLGLRYLIVPSGIYQSIITYVNTCFRVFGTKGKF
jgi:hypothetical protein